MTYEINKFIADELHTISNTERDVFGVLLNDCIRGMDVIRNTNAYPVRENIEKEEAILKEIICQ